MTRTKCPNTNSAEAMRKYRKNMKVGKPNEYKEFREREAHRLREFRKNLSAEKRRKYQDGTNERMRMFRERKKQATGSTGSVHPVRLYLRHKSKKNTARKAKTVLEGEKERVQRATIFPEKETNSRKGQEDKADE